MRTVIFFGLILIANAISTKGIEGDTVIKWIGWILSAAIVMDIIEFFGNLTRKRQ